jgi:hypothetical protein
MAGLVVHPSISRRAHGPMPWSGPLNYQGSPTISILANASVVGIDANRQITVIAGGGGTTDFAVDVVGYS